MYTNICGGTVYTNQGGSPQARLQPSSSCQSLGHPPQNASEMGAGDPKAAGTVSPHAASDPRCRNVGSSVLERFPSSDRLGRACFVNIRRTIGKSEQKGHQSQTAQAICIPMIPSSKVQISRRGGHAPKDCRQGFPIAL